MPEVKGASTQFAIRVPSIEALFVPFDARPVADRELAEEVRLFLLDQWELVRYEDEPPKLLTIYVPEGERSETDPEAVKSAFHKTMEGFTGPYRHAVPMSRRQRVTALVGTIVFLASIVVSTILERLTNDVLIAGLGQGIVVIGWVALWAPAQYVVSTRSRTGACASATPSAPTSTSGCPGSRTPCSYTADFVAGDTAVMNASLTLTGDPSDR